MQQQALLKNRETISVLILVALIGAMTLHALKVSVNELSVETQIQSCAMKAIVVTIEGAVAKPGRYHFKKGTTLKDVLSSIELLPEADVSKMNMEQVLKKCRKIKIPFKKTKGRKKVQRHV